MDSSKARHSGLIRQVWRLHRQRPARRTTGTSLSWCAVSTLYRAPQRHPTLVTRYCRTHSDARHNVQSVVRSGMQAAVWNGVWNGMRNSAECPTLLRLFLGLRFVPENSSRVRRFAHRSLRRSVHRSAHPGLGPNAQYSFSVGVGGNSVRARLIGKEAHHVRSSLPCTQLNSGHNGSRFPSYV